MLYLVDGYNVTRADDVTRRLHPADQRLALMRRLAARGRELLGSGEIVVVWDKGPEDDPDAAPVRGLFAVHETADDVIVRIAEQNPGRVTLVTSDRELRDRVRTVAGAATPLLGCSSLFEARHVRPPRKRTRRDDGLPPGHGAITAELERVWLDGDADDDESAPRGRT